MLLCWSHIPNCLKSHVTAYMLNSASTKFSDGVNYKGAEQTVRMNLTVCTFVFRTNVYS